ncbi:MAG: phosphomannomutase/phosphoglucomutase [Xanthomonadales bacterium]|nr:phosphomannomutase/phosphoglucomutase [Xanthomonadales bacterium]
MLAMALMLFSGSSGERNLGKAQEQGERAVRQVSQYIQSVQRLLQDEQVTELAAMALESPEREAELQQYLGGRLREVQEVSLYPANAYLMPVSQFGEQAWIRMDMMLSARKAGVAPVQLMPHGEEQHLAGMVAIRDGEQELGFLMVTATTENLLSSFNMTLPAGGFIALQQLNGRFAPTVVRSYGDRSAVTNGLTRLTVPGSLLRIAIPRPAPPASFGAMERIMIFLLGALLLTFGVIKRQRALHPVAELKADPEALAEGGEKKQVKAPVKAKPGPEPKPAEEAPPAREVALSDLPFDVHERRRKQSAPAAPVELTPGIFRAYDIRGVVGETLDAGVARQVGQAIGTLAVEEEAGPLVVARDGRHSGPALVAGMIEGITSTGCDVIDIGAVPTGVLYFAAYECGSGSGVMVTGSHNPPDYNGFKVMIGGMTLSGEKITALYQRLEAGEIRIGKGTVREEDMVDRYRERISGDIQLKRPIKVVADCGNGIGGVCAVDVLRDIGAEVLPLFDDVDGDFPNHHPDPSDPHNLEDLIESVNLMGAELGVAFDGDADRLGVVTPDGEIIYADRIMMLYVREILSRNPGAPIIYDVKCTGKLDQVIRESGGEPEMYKTGHSLIKNRMKEVDAPFAGEMSGHFFFKDRWYGFDCGIYSAARLLEILAMDERTPMETLKSLPSSISTPELKVHMSEGENHAFVSEFQEKARFADARLSTIDGVRADFDYGWGLVRASNTTPILVVRFEADSEESLDIIKEAFRLQMLSIRKDLELPF